MSDAFSKGQHGFPIDSQACFAGSATSSELGLTEDRLRTAEDQAETEWLALELRIEQDAGRGLERVEEARARVEELEEKLFSQRRQAVLRQEREVGRLHRQLLVAQEEEEAPAAASEEAPAAFEEESAATPRLEGPAPALLAAPSAAPPRAAMCSNCSSCSSALTPRRSR